MYSKNSWERIWRIVLLTFIVLGLGSIVLPTFEHLHALASVFFIIGYASGGVFTLEYILRIVHAKRMVGKRHAVRSYIFSFSGIVDFISILPFTLPYVLPLHHDEIMLINFARVFLVFKLARYSNAFRMLGEVVFSVKKHLLTALLIPLVFASFSAILIYYIEGSVQPDKFTSLSDSFYWAIITMATVGYGDIVPLTDAGKLLSSLTALSGVMFIALPTGIMSSAFTTRMRDERKEHNETLWRGSSRSDARFTRSTTTSARRDLRHPR